VSGARGPEPGDPEPGALSPDALSPDALSPDALSPDALSPDPDAAEEVVVVETIPPAMEGERLDRAVSTVTGISRAEAAGLVRDGRVRVGGRPVTAKAHRVDAGDVVAVDLPGGGDADRPVAEPEVAVAVVHEDADVVVVDKPPGLVVHPGAGHRTGTLVNGLLARYPEIAGVGDPARPGIVHRLDKDTSGLLLVARSPAAYEGLVDALARRAIDRAYLALVWGALEAPTGLIDAAIGRSSRRRTKMAVSTEGREARTGYEVLESFVDPVTVDLLRCRLETGRTHQIRVHLAAIGHPVVGDDGYGGVRASFPVPRMVLHATEVGFTHPVTGERIELSSPLPPDLGSVLDRLRRR
jgi:23S rRNA pseudouridine1911/1915/1917 synthase